MLEQIKLHLVEKRPYSVFFIGIVYVFVGFFTSKIFFPNIVSIATLFLITLLLVPTIIKLLDLEEGRERKDGIKNFFQDHKDVFEIYVFLFLGVFVGVLLLSMSTPLENFNQNFDYQLDFLKSQEGLSSELIKTKTQTGTNLSFSSFLALVENNLFVILILFALSLFYGAGAVFLITLNASIFATFAAFVMRELPSVANKAALLGIFSVHMIPELAGFLLAAIGGGVVSKAVMSERFFSEPFRNVMKDAFVLFVISAVIIVIAAFLEAYVTTSLFNIFLVG